MTRPPCRARRTAQPWFQITDARAPTLSRWKRKLGRRERLSCFRSGHLRSQ